MLWEVGFTSKAAKQAKKLPWEIVENLGALVRELKVNGPERINWPSYSKLKGKEGCYHCHLRKGRPTYVPVWQVEDSEKSRVVIRYVGTHEGADYRRIC
jgi:mRNA-degrading endonuclease RelE of RelBE toxin-antitoxin system